MNISLEQKEKCLVWNYQKKNLLVDKWFLTIMENSKLDEYIIKSSETCIISEVQQEGSSARITFQLKNGDLLERVIRDSDVCYFILS